jgi:porphyrinogen peroxidase
MATPQSGIFALGTMSHAYLELSVRPDTGPHEVVQRVASLREPRSTIGGVNLVTGFRPELCTGAYYFVPSVEALAAFASTDPS